MTTIGDTINFKLSTDVRGKTLDVLSKAKRSEPGVYVRTYDHSGEQVNRLDLTAAEALDLAQALIFAARTSQQFTDGLAQAQAERDARAAVDAEAHEAYLAARKADRQGRAAQAREQVAANVAAARKARRSAHDQVRFVQINQGVYNVLCDTVLVGTVQKHTDEYGTEWRTFYNDGSKGHSADTRIDAAWRLINS